MKQFSPLVEFTCKELGGSVYVPGLTYTIRDGNTILEDLAEKWEEEGKISFGIVTEGLAQGKG